MTAESGETLNSSAREAARDFLCSLKRELADEIFQRIFEQLPEIASLYSPTARARCIEDLQYHLDHLAEALVCDCKALFFWYVNWCRQLILAHGIPESHLIAFFDAALHVLKQRAPSAIFASAAPFLREGKALFEYSTELPASHLSDSNPLKPVAEKFLGNLLHAQVPEAAQIIDEALAAGASKREIYGHVFIQTQREIGRLWMCRQISVAQEHFVTAATSLIAAKLSPRLFERKAGSRRILLLCATGELHEMGMRLVADILEMDGWEPLLLGQDVPINAAISFAKENQPAVIGISMTMTTHLTNVRDLIRGLREEVALKGTPIVVSGAPFHISSRAVQYVGADGVISSAEDAANIIKDLVSKLAR